MSSLKAKAAKRLLVLANATALFLATASSAFAATTSGAVAMNEHSSPK